MLTKQARPNLASQAPIDSKIIEMNMSEGGDIKIYNLINPKIIPSKASRAISKCLRCNITVRIAEIIINGSKEIKNKGMSHEENYSFLRFTRPMLIDKLSWLRRRVEMPDVNSQS